MQNKKSWLQVITHESLQLCRVAREVLYAHRKAFMAFGFYSVILIALVMATLDVAMNEIIKFVHEEQGTWYHFAGRLRKWGRGYDAIFFIGMVASGAWLFRSKALARTALACTLALALAGISVNFVRATTGRPRPRLEQPFRLTGPSLVFARQSFPSGHTGAAFATAACLTTVNPMLGGFAVISAAAIGLGSWLSYAHYVSDIIGGMAAGIFWGVLFGLACRRINQKDTKA